MNDRTVHHLRPVDTRSKFELRLDVHLPEQPRRKSRSKSSGSIDTADVGGEVCSVQESASNDLTGINYITVTFSNADGVYHELPSIQVEEIKLMYRDRQDCIPTRC